MIPYKKLKYLLVAALNIGLFAACNDDEIEYNKEIPAESALALKVDTNEVELNVRTPNNTALIFSWTTGTNGGTNTAIDYELQIDKQGNNFANALSIDLGRRKYSYEYKTEQLNDLLLGEFAIPIETFAYLEARIFAYVAAENVSDQTSEVLPFSVKTYMPVSKTLFLIGDATLNGWSLDKATPLNAVSNETGGFVVTTDLGVGNFKFLTTTDDFLPSYNRDGASATPKLIYRDSDSKPDEQFHVDEAGRFRIKVNLCDLTITMTQIELDLPRYSKMYFVGDFTGWGFEEMRQDHFNAFIFRYGAVLNGGGGRDFKFGTTAGSWSNMFHPTIADAPYTHTAAMFDDTNDLKWVLKTEENGKAYKIAIDITEGKEQMLMEEYTPLTTIYVIGSASPIGWSLGDRANAQMTEGSDAYTYTWSGTLGEGELKFKCSDDSSWDNNDTHPWYMAPDENQPVVADSDMELTLGTRGGGDRKWIVKESGNYTITINQLTETVRFEKK